MKANLTFICQFFPHGVNFSLDFQPDALNVAILKIFIRLTYPFAFPIECPMLFRNGNSCSKVFFVFCLLYFDLRNVQRKFWHCQPKFFSLVEN